MQNNKIRRREDKEGPVIQDLTLGKREHLVCMILVENRTKLSRSKTHRLHFQDLNYV